MAWSNKGLILASVHVLAGSSCSLILIARLAWQAATFWEVSIYYGRGEESSRAEFLNIGTIDIVIVD